MPAVVGDSSTKSSNQRSSSALKNPLTDNAKVSSPSLSRLSSTEDSIPKQPQQQRPPYLANLRSAWSSHELKTGSTTVDTNAHDIGLPRIELPPRQASSHDDLLQNEVKRLQLATPVASIAGLLIAGGWHSMSLLSVIVAWILLYSIDMESHRVVAQQALSVLTLVWTFIYHNSNMIQQQHHQQDGIISMISFGLVSAATCLSIVAGRIDQVSQQQFKDERKRAQAFVNEAVKQLKDQRLSFLSTISQEVQDAALMVITTLEQFSPSSILTDTHELLSACSIAVPIASISAINTTIKQVCYVSSHLQLLSRLLNQPPNQEEESAIQSDVRVEFDVGDLVQNVGDALAGMAARLDVNLVVYHSENGMHYTNVLGDEGAIRHGLLNLLRNILEGCTPGAIIELGLNIGSTETQGKILVTFEIIHSTSPAIPDGLSSAMLPNANLTVQLLQFIGAKLSVEDGGKNKTRYEVTLEMDMGSKGTRRLLVLEKSTMLSMNKQLASIKFSNEPTLKDLTKFIESLKGLRMVLHARERSVFAKHLTSCLAGWNTDISHVPVVRQAATPLSDNDDASTVASDESGTPLQHPEINTSTPESTSTTATTPAAIMGAQGAGSGSPRITNKIPSPANAEEQIHSIPPAFVLIDDDVETLERKIKEFRSQPPVSANTLQHQHHMRRHKHSKSSANNNAGNNSVSNNYFHQGTTAIIHFTSLNNFKRVRDTLQWLASTSNTPFSMPRLVVVPKPAGPRRFLTALHTAWNNAVVEPQFIPIATSPLSPMPQTPLASVMQQRDSYTPPTPGSAYVGTPGAVSGHDLDKHHRRSPATGEQSTGRRGRPSSGVYSPPHMSSAGDGSEGGNYFSMVGNGGGSGSGTSIGSSAATRRRSHTELGLQQKQQQQQQPQDNKQDGSSGLSSTAQQVGATMATSGVTSSTLPDMNHGDQQQQQQSSSNMTSSPLDGSNKGASGSASTPSTTTANENSDNNNTKKTTISGPRKMNFKLNKRKKASAFANVVSPPINVLIVEDNMINQAILSTWMKKHKIKCSVASNGQEAVERWKGGGFHLVLMDIQLPVMDGIEATKTIRAIEKEQRIGVLPTTSPTPSGSTVTMDTSTIDENTSTANTPTDHDTPLSTFRSPVIIVALTASSLESDRHAALAAGCNDFLTKPVSLEWLEKKTIEWGCMQALIDFEGWRRWKRSATDKPALKTSAGQNNNSTVSQKESIVTSSKTALSSSSTTTKQIVSNNKKNEEEGVVGSASIETLTKTTSTTTGNSSTTTTSMTTDMEEEHHKKIQSPSSSTTTRNKGIVLPGAAGFSKRRFSTFDDKQTSRGKSILLMSKSGSDSDLLTGRPQGDKDRRQPPQQSQQPRPSRDK
ncbi:hypothetical protein BDA99DRAFT_607523 [Phascolomyces articulosus]|uniref:Response regulatory domain-containing protein n=1 Tax=Phascolomyces articulosus TaxID=60185 RepID=A0AAD5JT31_9FUNG|nr:hypothetical protein BDA99DRAFT_607523 [Phascolomyces articulosus]